LETENRNKYVLENTGSEQNFASSIQKKTTHYGHIGLLSDLEKTTTAAMTKKKEKQIHHLVTGKTGQG